MVLSLTKALKKHEQLSLLKIKLQAISYNWSDFSLLINSCQYLTGFATIYVTLGELN